MYVSDTHHLSAPRPYSYPSSLAPTLFRIKNSMQKIYMSIYQCMWIYFSDFFQHVCFITRCTKCILYLLRHYMHSLLAKVIKFTWWDWVSGGAQLSTYSSWTIYKCVCKKGYMAIHPLRFSQIWNRVTLDTRTSLLFSTEVICQVFFTAHTAKIIVCME